MAVGRDPVDRVLDVLVSAPIATAITARDAVPMIARAGARRLRPVLRSLARSLAVPLEDHPPSGGLESGAAPWESAPEPPIADPAIGKERAAADAVGALTAHLPAAEPLLPIDDYDHLAARQVVDRLPSLRPDELEAVRAYEASHRRRRTVLGRIEQLTA